MTLVTNKTKAYDNGDDGDWLEPKEKCLHHISSDHPKKGNHQQQATKPDVNHLDLDIWSDV